MLTSPYCPTAKILWVDDKPEYNKPIADDLARRGYHISYALSTSLALTLLARNRYDVVISDVGRKEGPREGYHLLDVMRGRGDATPFVFYASLDALELREEALLHDAQGSTNNPAKLLALVDALVQESGQGNAQEIGDRAEGGA